MPISTLTKNFTALLVSNFAVQLIRLFTVALIARRLGNSYFGIYNYITLLVIYGFIVTEFGLKNLAIREMAQGRGSRDLIEKIIKLRLLLATFGCLAVAALCAFAFRSFEFLGPSLFFALSLFFDAALVDFVLISHEKLAVQAWGNVIQAGFFGIGCFWMVRSSQDFSKLALLFSASHGLWAGYLYWKSRIFIKNLPVKALENLWNIGRGGAPFLVAQLLNTILYSMDLLLLGQFHYQQWLGDYSAALKILSIPTGIIAAMLSAVQPRLARHSEDFFSSHSLTLISGTTRFIWVMVAPAVLGCWFFGDTLVFWILGPGFPRAAEILRPLSLAFGLFSLALVPLHTLMVSSQTRVFLRIIGTGFCVSAVVIGAILYAGRPQWVPWAMVGIQAMQVILAWQPFRFLGLLSREEPRTLLLPAMLLAFSLSASATQPGMLRFTLAAASYVGGLLIMKIWTRPWFVAILKN